MNKTITEYVNGHKPDQVNDDYNWYTKLDEQIYDSVFRIVDRIDQDQSYRSSMNVRHARLYNNMETLGLATYGSGAVNSQTNREQTSHRVTYNLVKSCVDTVSSKIAKQRPKPQFLTDGGDYALQDKAQKLTQYIEGMFYQSGYYNQSSKIFLDSCVFGTGIMKFYEYDNQIKCERVIPEEIKVDNNDAVYGKPKSMFQVKQLSRDVLIELYPDEVYYIQSASSSTPDTSNVDLIKVIEAWHLGKNGKHVISIENRTLFAEDYDKDYFPFVFLKWSEQLTGFFGQGLAEELTGTQIEINKILKNIQKAINNVAIPRVAIESNAKLSTSMITNEIGSIVKYQGGSRPPIFDTPTGMNPEVYNHLKWLIESGYEKTGVSQLSATSKKPSGLDSAVALREYSDIETERFMLTALKYEELALDAAKIIIDMSKDMFENNKKLKVKVPGKDFIKTISWKDVNLEEDQYMMKAYPVGVLPNQPAGRLQKVQELIQAGWIDKEKALELLDFPDLKQWESLETANNKLIEKSIHSMLTTGKYQPPEPQMDLVVAAGTAHKHYLKGRVDELPEARLELLLRYIDDAERLDKASQPTQPNLPPEPEIPLQAVPEALPTGELLPQVEQPLPLV